MGSRFAWLVPTYNGGALLRETVLSCGRTDLAAEDYCVVVVDNASTDGSVDPLPARLPDGARVLVHRNAENVGRVGNWNQALAVAASLDARFGSFLFVGDVALPRAPLGALLTTLERADAVLGLAPNAFLDEHGNTIAVAQRLGHLEAAQGVPSADLLRVVIGAGALLLGPLQANVIRVDAAAAPQFDPALPTHTDQFALIEAMVRHPGPVVVSRSPIVGWRRHAKRFHASMDLAQRVREDMAMFRRAAALTGVAPRWANVRAAVLLQYANSVAAGREFTWRDLRTVIQCLRADGPVALGHAVRLVARRVLARRGLVSGKDFPPT